MAQRAIIYGGCGALGRVIVSRFKQAGWSTISVDLTQNDEADSSVTIAPGSALLSQEETVVTQIGTLLGTDKVQSIICVAGGWAGGNASNKSFIKNSEAMIQQSIWSSLICARLAALYLAEGGLITLTGAQAALLGGTPGMIGYGLAKGAVHHLVSSLAADGGGLPANSAVAAILPVTLDTPMNRKWMPDADTSTWTSLDFVAGLLFSWTTQNDPSQPRPSSGSLVQLVTEQGQTRLVIS